MSLVKACLESLGEYPSNGYKMSPKEASKYTLEDGAFLINMEALSMLNDIYDLDLAVETTVFQGVANAKQYGMPVEEGLKDIGNKVKAKISGAWTKVKEWFQKMKEKMKAWFENVKRVFRSMFSKPEDFVKRYRNAIESVDGDEIAPDIMIYKYTNIDSYGDKLASFQTSATDHLMKGVEDSLANVDAHSGNLSTRNDDVENESNIHASVMASVAKRIEEDIKKEFGDKDDRSKKLFAYFRGGATGEDDKVIPSSLDMKAQVSYVLDNKKIIAAITTQQNKVDTIYKKVISTIEQWQAKYGNGDAAKSLTELTASANAIQTAVNDATNAYITAAKERASTAFAICKKAMSIKHKNDKAAEREKAANK